MIEITKKILLYENFNSSVRIALKISVLLICIIMCAISCHNAQDKSQLALDIADAQQKNIEQLINYSWQRSLKVYLNEEEMTHTVVKVWFKEDGMLDGQDLSSPEENQHDIGEELTDLLEQSFSVSSKYLFLPKEDFANLLDKAEIVTEGENVKITIKDFLVKDDEVQYTIDESTKLLQSIKISSVVLGKSFSRSMSFKAIGDGVIYPDQSVVEIPSVSLKEITKTIQIDKKDDYDYTTLKALGPLVGKALLRGQLFIAACELTEPDPNILSEYDVKIPMSEGYFLTANIFRSKRAAEKGEKVPVIMCAHPYNNHLTAALGETPFNGAPQQYRMIPQAGKPEFSELTSWESPDPNFWVSAGYAVVNMNLPGYSNSEGPPSAFSEHQGKSYYEAIEWIAKQPWCTGKVGLSGVSFLAISQYHVAACQAYGGPPPSLRCISPWEGLTDVYRDIFCAGGVTEVGFPTFWWATEVDPAINGTQADFVKAEGSIPTDYLKNHPFYDDFWKAKAAKLDEITIPMLVCASFSDHGLHTMGSFRAFEKAKSKYKWVYTHRWGKWDAYYSSEVQEMTKNFMDCFLKDDTSSGYLDTPPVRLEVRSSLKEIHEVRYENEWPIARTQYNKLYLSERPQSLSIEKSDKQTEVEYSAEDEKAFFNFKFKENTELSGYMKARVWVEARSNDDGEDAPDDMVMFVAVNKLDREGKTVNFYGSVGNTEDMITRGWCKVSRRELDPEESTEWHPVQSGTSEQLLKPGEIVSVDIELYPSSTFFKAGESIQLIIASDEIIPSPPYKKSIYGNRGNHVIHFGGKYDSYLLVPKIPPKV